MPARMPDRRCDHDDTGFTLIELLIGFAITALLAGFLFSGLRIATRSEDAVTREIARSTEIAAVHAFLRAEVANARALQGRWPNAGAAVSFSGRADQVRFVGLLPGALGRGGLQLLQIGLADADRGARRLVVRWRAYDPQVAPSEGDFTGTSILLGHVATVEFAYFGSLAPSEPGAWHGAWADTDRLPSLVSLHLVPADGRPIPDCVIAPRALPLVETARMARVHRTARRAARSGRASAGRGATTRRPRASVS